ncbi:MAG: MBL fold metallo-hydrolase, partial [Eubacteriales bacterium]
MKRIQLIFLTLTLLFLPWTAASCGGSPSEEAAGQVQAGQAETADPYKTDRELRTDYENIVPSGEHEVRILFVNAGRADSILIEADGKYYVIDTGEVTSVPKINASLEYLGADKIEAVFLTHSNS